MAIKTMTSTSTGQNKWEEGWHTVSISEAIDGAWNDKKYIELKFFGYPDTLSLRVYEAHNKETHEEFNIAKLFKLANAGLIDEIKSPDGKTALQYDDDPKNLVDQSLTVLFYKDSKGYIKISDRIAPVEQEGQVVSFSENDVKFWKDKAEEDWINRLKPQAEATENTTSTGTEEEVPF